VPEGAFCRGDPLVGGNYRCWNRAPCTVSGQAEVGRRSELVLFLLAACGSQQNVEPPITADPGDVDSDTYAVAPDLVVTALQTTEPAPDTWPSGRQGLHERRIAQTGSGQQVAVWSALDGDEVTLWVQWAEGDAMVIDAVQTTPPHAAQSDRSLFDVAVTAHGEDAVAVAWRPLVDGASPQRAEVRWTVLHERVQPTWESESLTAHALLATSGIGPYSYADSRLRSGTLDGHGLFVWVGDAGVRAVHADLARPVSLPMRSSHELILSNDGEGMVVTGHDYWCDDGQTHSSSCRSVEEASIRIP